MTSTWSLLPSTSDSSTIRFRDEWRALLESSNDPFGLYQSPEWFELIQDGQTGDGPRHAVAVLRDEQDRLIGVVPLFVTREQCRFPLVFGRVYTTSQMKMITLLSGRLLLSPGESRFDGLFASIAEYYPDRPVLKIERIPRPGPLHDYLRSSVRIRERYFLQEVPGQDRVHTIPLPPSFQQFLARYSAKKRYNLRRQLRLLRARTARRLTMSRFDSIRDVQDFVTQHAKLRQAYGKIADAAVFVEGCPFEVHHRRLASNGLLRSYVLLDGEHPVASILGFQFRDTLLIGETVYDPAYAEFSPGCTLLHMVIEDLINHGRMKLINLGYSARESFHASTNVALDYVSYWLIPKTWRSRMFLTSYTASRRVIASLKSARTPPTRERLAQWSVATTPPVESGRWNGLGSSGSL